MRFMLLMIPKGYEKAAPGTMPDSKAVQAMMRYNESLKEAVEWAMRCPGSGNETIEVRQVQEMSEFPSELQSIAAKAGLYTPEGGRA